MGTKVIKKRQWSAMASISNSVYGDRVLTDKPPFNFPRRVLAFVAWIRAGAYCCHLTWAEGSLGCGWAEMGLRGPLSVGAGYFMYLNTSFGQRRRRPCWSLGFFTQRGSSNACSFSIKCQAALQIDWSSGSGGTTVLATCASWSS